MLVADIPSSDFGMQRIYNSLTRATCTSLVSRLCSMNSVASGLSECKKVDRVVTELKGVWEV
jgi:hypothetical protein